MTSGGINNAQYLDIMAVVREKTQRDFGEVWCTQDLTFLFLLSHRFSEPDEKLKPLCPSAFIPRMHAAHSSG